MDSVPSVAMPGMTPSAERLSAARRDTWVSGVTDGDPMTVRNRTLSMGLMALIRSRRTANSGHIGVPRESRRFYRRGERTCRLKLVQDLRGAALSRPPTKDARGRRRTPRRASAWAAFECLLLLSR